MVQGDRWMLRKYREDGPLAYECEIPEQMARAIADAYGVELTRWGSTQVTPAHFIDFERPAVVTLKGN